MDFFLSKKANFVVCLVCVCVCGVCVCVCVCVCTIDSRSIYSVI